MEFGTYCADSYSISPFYFFIWKVLDILSSPKDGFITIADYSYSENNKISPIYWNRNICLFTPLKSGEDIF